MKGTIYHQRLRQVERNIVETVGKLEGKFGLSGFSERMVSIKAKNVELKSLAQLDAISEFLERLAEIDDTQEIDVSLEINENDPKDIQVSVRLDEEIVVEIDNSETEMEADKPPKKQDHKATKSKQEKLL